MRFGDVAVFCVRTADVRAMLALLKQRRIAGQDLTAYKGRTTRAVKVGTYHRAKGLEFKEVYLPHVSAGLVPPSSRSADPREAEELARRRFFVGMTRDRLVITWSGRGRGSWRRCSTVSAVVVELLARVRGRRLGCFACPAVWERGTW